MKTINTIVYSLLLLVLLGGCLEEKGNYDYIPQEELFSVTVEGLPQDTTFLPTSMVQLTPVLKGLNKPESAYEFTWYAYPVGVSGYVPQRDTLGREKNLTFQMMYAPGQAYKLFFVIRDVELDIRHHVGMNISSQSIYSTGYYITKDVNDETDVDYINLKDEQYADIISPFLGRKLPGKAVKTHYQSSRYYHVTLNDDGTTTTLSNQPVLHVLSDKDACIMQANSLKFFKDLNTMIYGEPLALRPTDVVYTTFGGNSYFLNGGGLHSIYGMSPNFGIFGDYKNKYTDLFDKFIVNSYPSGALCFDKTTRTFCYASVSHTVMQTLNAPPAGSSIQVSTTEMNADMICLLDRANSSMHMSGWPAFALMKSVSGPQEYYLADISFSSGSYPFVDLDTLGAGRKLPYGEVFAAHRITPCIYFANGNSLSYYAKNAEEAASEEVVDYYQFPAGEQISYMDHQYSSSYDNLAVLTNKDGQWKLYLFPILSGTPRFDPEKVKVYSGTGNARHVMRR